MNCPTCGQPGTFYPQYNRYYCHKCAKYIENIPPPPPPPAQIPPPPPATPKPETKTETKPETPKPEVTQTTHAPTPSQPTSSPSPSGTAPAPSATQQTIQQGRNWHIEGHIVPTVVMNLAPGESIKVQPGAMMSRDPTVAMQTGTHGGLGKALTMKFLAGESMSIVIFTGPGQVRITGGVVGKIEAIQIQGYPIRVRGGAFIAAETTVDMDVQMEKLGTAIIGGTGLFQIRMFGYGTAFIQSAGDIISGYLQPGQSIIIDEEHFLACDEGVQRIRERVQGLRNIISGGEGLFTLRLVGPGRYWLESGSRMEELRARVASNGGSGPL